MNKEITQWLGELDVTMADARAQRTVHEQNVPYVLQTKTATQADLDETLMRAQVKFLSYALFILELLLGHEDKVPPDRLEEFRHEKKRISQFLADCKTLSDQLIEEAPDVPEEA